MRIVKTLLVIGLVCAVSVLGWLRVRDMRLDLGFTKGVTVEVKRGDLTIPIAAVGEVEPKTRSEIKAEASGEVAEVYFKAGDMVREGETIILIKPDDEQRNVERVQSEVRGAKARLKAAKARLLDSRNNGLPSAQANLAQLEAQLKYAEFNLAKTKSLYESKDTTDDEMIQVQAQYDQLIAQINAAKAQVGNAKQAIELAETDVELAQTAYESALTLLGDAEKQLAKTRILAPSDGLLLQVYRKKGEVIQGGKTTFTGGTVLAILADWSERYVRAEVDEADIGVVLELAPNSARPGQEGEGEEEVNTNGKPVPIKEGSIVKVAVEAFPGEDFEGIIERIYPEPKKSASVVTFLVDIRVISENKDKLMVSMQADVTFTAQSVKNAVLVPHEAVRRGPNDELGVYVPGEPVQGEERTRPVFIPCRFGLDNGSYAEAIEGVKEGTFVYTKLPINPNDGKEEK